LRLGLHIGLLHLVLASAAFFAWSEDPVRLATAEVGLALSALVGWHLVRRVDAHRRLVLEGRDLLRDEDFSARLREVGLVEVDELVGLFNATIERLRRERIHAREQEAFLERLVEASPTAILLLDLDGKVATVNPAARSLLPAATPGRRLAELPEPGGTTLAALGDGESAVFAAGARRFKAARARFWDRGFPRSFVLVEELTEELRRGERDAWGRLLRTISHEVNNSAGALASLLDSCRAELAEGGDHAAVDEALAAGSRRIRALEAFVAGYAEVVRLPAPARQRLDLGALLDDLALVLGPELTARHITLGWGRRDRDAVVHADPNQIERVLVNVLRNAAESIGEGGAIELSLERTRREVVLQVRDNGAGVEPDAREHLFTPFFSTKRDGRGLGLTLVREILAGHGFEGTLEDGAGVSPRRGACFTVRARVAEGGGRD
jgi:nitrogen fixation/metabolism regulation signal transduction histidine kinase